MESLNKYYLFLKENNINNVEELKLYISNDVYKLKYKENKENKENSDLILIYSNEESNNSHELVRFFNGVILDKNTLKIVCYTLDKCLEDDNINDILMNDVLDNRELIVQQVFEGTLIRVFYHDDGWKICTKKMLNAYNAKWSSNKSFGEMFEEVFSNYLDYFANMNKNYCYSFLMGHNQNNIIEIENNYIIHLNTIDLLNNIVINDKIDIHEKNIKHISNYEQKINIMDKEELMNFIDQCRSNTEIYSEIGYMFLNKNRNICQKFIKNNFKEMREIWGNTNNRLFQYLHLRKNHEKLKKYLEYFKKDKDILLEYENYLMNIASYILNIYRNKHISKTITSVPLYIRDIIYKVHGLYKQTKNKVSFQDINIILYDLDEKRFCSIINNIEKERKAQIEEKAKEYETMNETINMNESKNDMDI